MGRAWSVEAARFLTDPKLCPRCESILGGAGRCSRCGADLGGEVAAEVWAASARAADAIVMRQEAIDRLPTIIAAPVARPATPWREPQRQPMVAATVSSPSSGSSQISVQSVLAVVGAALLGVAAIVFTFLNPDLTNFATRTTIVAGVTVVFLVGAWLLARARLQFSAESIGALGVVFLILDVWALSSHAPTSISVWAFAGIATLVCSAGLTALAALVRIRSWLWASLVGLILTPVLFAAAVDSKWSEVVGSAIVAVVAFVVHVLARRLGARLASPLLSDRSTATVIQIVAMVAAAVGLPFVTDANTVALAFEQAAVLVALAALAALSSRNQLRGFWCVCAGVLVTFAAVVASLAIAVPEPQWRIALEPLTAAIVLAALAVAAPLRAERASAFPRRRLVLIGAWAAALTVAVPAAVTTGVEFFTPFEPLLPRTLGLAAIAALVSVALGSWSLSRLAERTAFTGGLSPVPALGWLRGVFIVSLWLGMLALLAVVGWQGLAHPVQAAAGLVAAVALSVVLVRVRAVRSSALPVRLPLIVGAHLTAVLAAAIGWADPVLSVVVGAAVVITVIALAQTIPAHIRPIYAGAGYAYALIVFAHSMSLLRLDTIAVLCLTTSLAAVFALVVTLVRRLSAGFWYAILAVTLIPFLIGVISVLFVRSGWTALSTGVTFALALTLVITTRPGLSRVLRSIAAALLVPALAVVVVCLGAQVIIVSASPITLPIIAVIVACTLPSTPLIVAALGRRGMPTVDANQVRLWIEISSLVTAGLAVLLSLVRAAAGLDTSFVVLVILGLGGLVAGRSTHRRYAWIVAGVSWTGALWCFWAIVGVQVLEPYILPPALAAATLGAISVFRKLPGAGLYSIGLACATVPSLAVLAFAGNGSDALPWRALGLLAGAAVLVAVGTVLGRPEESELAERLGALRAPTLAVAIAASAAGAIQAIRYGWALDPSSAGTVMAPVLGLTAAATVLAGLAGARLLDRAHPDDAGSHLHGSELPGSEPRGSELRGSEPRGSEPRGSEPRGSRWRYAPALVFLVVGPMTAIRPDWFSIGTLWLLTAVLLAIMIVASNRTTPRSVTLPPVWFLFALAWCTAVDGWSQRALRVEAFSLPLGLALLAAGIIAMRRVSSPRQTDRPAGFNTWPIGFESSWPLLTPGIIVTFLPSVLATGTDPQTLRAILVISLALVAILIGSLRKLAAPFILGIIVLPIENITVFAVQVGRSIGATPWWITLATAGAVLLVIAVTYERRDIGERGVAARLRDLR
jgi:hypothetical protein